MGCGALEDSRPLRIRAFFGLPVPEPQRGRLGAFVAACSAVAPEFRWTATSNLHLTIRFVGSVDRSSVEGIADRLAELPIAGFEVAPGEPGTFKRGRLAIVVWLGLRLGGGAARTMAAQVEAECRAAGLKPELRAFQPHITLARSRHRDGGELARLPAVPHLDPWRATELVLYSSRLARTGAMHEELRILSLGAPSPSDSAGEP